jgi:two-component system nitrogen regulation response regulator GlnG
MAGEKHAHLYTTTLHDTSAGDEAAPRVPALTVLGHPIPSRIGERVRMTDLMVGKAVHVSRLEPEFAQPDRATRGPLADPYLSRRPMVLSPLPLRGVRIDASESGMEILVDGAPIAGHCDLPSERVSEGIVIDLGGRVVLLLHRLGPPGPRTPRLGLVGDNPELERIRMDVLRVADLQVPVLIRGETGTGKELVATAIHGAGPRSEGPFVGVNMAVLERLTAASELFGHARGAFAGAGEEHTGYFVRAHGGTLFFDEIGAASPEVQSMLLRVLENSEVQPLGEEAPTKVDVRLCAATDRDLEAGVRQGTFLAPLFHRLTGFEITLPTLRKRRDDIGRLALHFLREELEAIGASHHLADGEPGAKSWIPASLMSHLARYHWPGNVRQLRNVCRQLVIANRGKSDLQMVPAVERLLSEGPGASPGAGGDPSGEAPPPVSAERLLQSLRTNKWRIGPTAAQLGLPRNVVARLIEAHPRIRRAQDVSPEEITEAHQACLGDLDAMSAKLEVSRRALERRVRALGL